MTAFVGVFPPGVMVLTHFKKNPLWEFGSLSLPCNIFMLFLSSQRPDKAGNPLQSLNICQAKRIFPSATSGLFCVNVTSSASFSRTILEVESPLPVAALMLPESSSDKITLGAGALPVAPAGDLDKSSGAAQAAGCTSAASVASATAVGCKRGQQKEDFLCFMAFLLEWFEWASARTGASGVSGVWRGCWAPAQSRCVRDTTDCKTTGSPSPLPRTSTVMR